MDIEDKIRELRSEISTANSKKARAAVELENAKSRVADARRILEEEFGVTTSEQAQNALNTLQAELDEAVAEVEKALAEAAA